MPPQMVSEVEMEVDSIKVIGFSPVRNPEWDALGTESEGEDLDKEA